MSTLSGHPNIFDAAQGSAPFGGEYDAIIIGSGAGGAVLAKELAEGGVRVVIVEEGGVPPEPRELSYPSFIHLYRDSGCTATLGKPFIPVPMGKCLGGTTTVNSGTCFRTPDKVMESWRNDSGLNELDGGVLARAFDRVERELGIAPADFSVMSRPNVLVHELLLAQGFQGAPLRRNAPGCQGCGMCCYGCTSGAKQSMDVSYLPKALRAGATAYVHARASRIVLDRHGAAAGVLVQPVDARSRPAGPGFTLRAPMVVAACGTLLTPRLLQRSGLARGNRHLGRHLTIHPASKVVAEFDERIDCWKGIPQAYYCDVLHDDGIMFEGVTMPPDLGPPSAPFLGKDLAHYIARYGHMASFGFLISDTAEGHMVRVPGVDAVFRYSLSATDVRRIRRAIAFLARLFLRGGARRVYAMVTRPDNQFTTLAEVDRFEQTPLRAADLDCMAFHPLGTCRMASGPDRGVCGPGHQVFGAPGVYVCDGSVVPTALGVNPQETIMGLATRLAGQLLGKELA
jgi:choline dehydrogenase-like flavoprotein